MTERRYSEEEVAAIFERAAEAQATGTSPVPRDGRTLAELQAIGADVGIPPELVAHAARSLDATGRPTRERFLGLPLAVGRTIELDRHLTDDEWAGLVADLRMTFNARGRVHEEGPFRQWSNGNLRATVERTETGDRLRIRTLKGDARGLMNAGLAMTAMAIALLLVFVLGGDASSDSGSALLLALIGLGTFGAGALQLPGWAARRLEQMEGVARRAAALTAPPEPHEQKVLETPGGRVDAARPET